MCLVKSRWSVSIMNKWAEAKAIEGERNNTYDDVIEQKRVSSHQRLQVRVPYTHAQKLQHALCANFGQRVYGVSQCAHMLEAPLKQAGGSQRVAVCIVELLCGHVK